MGCLMWPRSEPTRLGVKRPLSRYTVTVEHHRRSPSLLQKLVYVAAVEDHHRSPPLLQKDSSVSVIVAQDPNGEDELAMARGIKVRRRQRQMLDTSGAGLADDGNRGSRGQRRWVEKKRVREVLVGR